MTHSLEQGGGKHIAKGLEIRTLRRSDREINREAPELQAHMDKGKMYGKICFSNSQSPGYYGGHEHWVVGEGKGPSKRK